MTDTKTLLQSAARCRRMAERCANEAIARKFEALARDYEEHARNAGKGQVIVDFSGPSVEKTKSAPKAPDTMASSTRDA